ncbi:MAG TPA: site-2 protease family protein [Nakamurella multipartita]|jgi:Zn-dependent protease|nr:site-2 protease family protein [Nakamurella multipartita]
MAKSPGGSWIFPVIVLVTAGAGVAAQASTRSSGWLGVPVGVWVFLVVLGGWVITLCLHEFAHALVAYVGGDTSVRARGYLTLNPARYTDLATSVIMPIILLAVGGIPLPGGAVLVEPGRLRRRWFASLVSAAGPLTNVVAGVVLAVVAAPISSPLGAALSYLALLQFVAGILNILPIPGFDGFGVLEPYLSPRFTERLRPARPWIPLVAFIILFSVPQASRALFGAANELFVWAGGNTALAAIGSSLFRFWA